MESIFKILQGRFAKTGYKTARGTARVGAGLADMQDLSDLRNMLTLAHDHGVDWLVCDELQRAFSTESAAYQLLTQASRDASIAALRNCADLLQIGEICQVNAVPVFFYKGAALAAAIHGSVAARRYGDIDLLVPTYEQAERLKQLLHSKGYRSVDELSDNYADLKKRYHIEFQLVSPAGIGVDIHWKLFHDYYIYPSLFENIFANKWLSSEVVSNEEFGASQRFVANKIAGVKVCGREISTFCPEDNLLMLCIHHTTHCFNELRMVCDIAGLIKAAPELDYRSVFARARQAGALRMLATGLQLVKLAFAMDLPAAAEAEISKDRLSRVLAIGLLRRLRRDTTKTSKAEIMLIEIAARDSWRERLVFIWQAIVSPSDNDFKFVQLTPPWLWLYYLLRPVRQILAIRELFSRHP